METVVENVAAEKLMKHQFSEPWDDSDAVLIAENDKFYVHSVILGLASPVFKAMFDSNFKEGRDKVGTLPGKKSKDILEILNLTYPISYTIRVSSDCQEILKLAREYDMVRIKLLVDDFLVYKVPCSMERLMVADEFKLKLTREKHVKYYINTDNNVSNDVFTDDWKMVNIENKLQIFAGKIKISIASTRCGCFQGQYCGCDVNTVTKGKRIQTLRDMCYMVEDEYSAM